MIEYIVLFGVIYGGVWIARRTVNKRTWDSVAGKLLNGKPENILALNTPIGDQQVVKSKLISIFSDSEYKLVNDANNSLILEDKKASANPLNTMYFYPIYFSVDQNGQSRIEVGIADKSSFLGSKQDRLQKLQKLFDFITQSLK